MMKVRKKHTYREGKNVAYSDIAKLLLWSDKHEVKEEVSKFVPRPLQEIMYVVVRKNIMIGRKKNVGYLWKLPNYYTRSYIRVIKEVSKFIPRPYKK